MELHISAGSGCQQGSVFNLSLFKVCVLDMHLYIQCLPFMLTISGIKLHSCPRLVLFHIQLFLQALRDNISRLVAFSAQPEFPQ